MKYVSIDLETTGLDAETCQILSIGAVIEDTNKRLEFNKIPKFHCTILHRNIKGEPFALNMNREIIKDISDYISGNEEKREALSKEKGIFVTENLVVNHFVSFLEQNGFYFDNQSPIKINVAGKNFATFDKLFLDKLHNWKHAVRVNQRVIDPSIMFTDWKNDEGLPNTNTCLIRAGIDKETSHTAIEDAWDVITLLRTKY